LTYPDPSRG